MPLVLRDVMVYENAGKGTYTRETCDWTTTRTRMTSLGLMEESMVHGPGRHAIGSVTRMVASTPARS
jgi:hypothetical protein